MIENLQSCCCFSLLSLKPLFFLIQKHDEMSPSGYLLDTLRANHSRGMDFRSSSHVNTNTQTCTHTASTSHANPLLSSPQCQSESCPNKDSHSRGFAASVSDEWWFSKTLSCYNEQHRGETRGGAMIDMEISNCGWRPHTRIHLGGEWQGRGACREVCSFLLWIANV